MFSAMQATLIKWRISQFRFICFSCFLPAISYFLTMPSDVFQRMRLKFQLWKLYMKKFIVIALRVFQLTVTLLNAAFSSASFAFWSTGASVSGNISGNTSFFLDGLPALWLLTLWTNGLVLVYKMRKNENLLLSISRQKCKHFYGWYFR